MTTTNTPPPFQMPIYDINGIMRREWVLFFNRMYSGDPGTSWTPAFTSLTGSATATGKLYRISNKLAYITLDIVPSGSITSTAGTTYVTGFPLTITNQGACHASDETTNLALGTGMIQTNGRIYLPTWTASNNVTVTGIAEVS